MILFILLVINRPKIQEHSSREIWMSSPVNYLLTNSTIPNEEEISKGAIILFFSEHEYMQYLHYMRKPLPFVNLFYFSLVFN